MSVIMQTDGEIGVRFQKDLRSRIYFGITLLRFEEQ